MYINNCEPELCILLCHFVKINAVTNYCYEAAVMGEQGEKTGDLWNNSPKTRTI